MRLDVCCSPLGVTQYNLDWNKLERIKIIHSVHWKLSKLRARGHVSKGQGKINDVTQNRRPTPSIGSIHITFICNSPGELFGHEENIRVKEFVKLLFPVDKWSNHKWFPDGPVEKYEMAWSLVCGSIFPIPFCAGKPMEISQTCGLLLRYRAGNSLAKFSFEFLLVSSEKQATYRDA